MSKHDANILTEAAANTTDTLRATVPMALVDAVPVAFFCAAAALIGSAFGSALFWAGAVCCIAAGAGKVAWKFVLACACKDVAWLNRQFRVLMPTGFLLCVSAFIIGVLCGNVSPTYLAQLVATFPGCVLLAVGAVLLVTMGILANRLDMQAARTNWIEQGINSAAQLCILLAVALMWCDATSYQATDDALAALGSTDQVVVSTNGDVTLFDGPGTEDALVFYPGAMVDERAYAPLMRMLAEGGLDCYLVSMPYNLAILDQDAAQSIVTENAYARYYVGGHSLGGAMAATFASNHTEGLSGVVLLAAYPTSSLKEGQLSVASIVGSNDDVLNRDSYENGLQYMPDSFAETIVEGGNHAWFGSYGEQRGDGVATISHEEQWQQTVDAVLAML